MSSSFSRQWSRHKRLASKEAMRDSLIRNFTRLHSENPNAEARFCWSLLHFIGFKVPTGSRVHGWNIKWPRKSITCGLNWNAKGLVLTERFFGGPLKFVYENSRCVDVLTPLGLSLREIYRLEPTEEDEALFKMHYEPVHLTEL